MELFVSSEDACELFVFNVTCVIFCIVVLMFCDLIKVIKEKKTPPSAAVCVCVFVCVMDICQVTELLSDVMKE